MDAQSSLTAAIENAEALNADLMAQLSKTKAKIVKLDSALKQVRQAMTASDTVLHALKRMNPKSDWAGKRRKAFKKSFDDGGAAAQAGKDYYKKLDALKEQINNERNKLFAQRTSLEGSIADNSKMLELHRSELASGVYSEQGR